MAKYKNNIHELVIQLKALSDQTRLRLFLILQNRRICVCHLTQLVALAPSTVSKHLSILKAAKLVVSAKEGQWIYYSAHSVFPDLLMSLKQDESVHKDEITLTKILKGCCQ